MDHSRRKAFGLLGGTAIAGAAVLGTASPAVAAAPVVNANRWNELRPNRPYERKIPNDMYVYESMEQGVMFVTAIVYYRGNGDCRGFVSGYVDGQVRSSATVTWNQASAVNENSLTLFVNRGQRFTIVIRDDLAKNFGTAWDILVLTSGACRPV